MNIFEFDDGHHWPKDFLPVDCHVILHVGKYGRLDEIAKRSRGSISIPNLWGWFHVPFFANSATTAQKLSPFLLASFYVSHHLIKLQLGYL